MSDWADDQQFHQDARFTLNPDGGTQPQVRLMWMTPDPLGAIAALASMYEGRVVRSLNELTDEDRRKAFDNTQRTHLRAPLEAVKMHFLIEGVDRAFTHQLVRQRTAVYAQESLRFAVVDDLLRASTLPPSLRGTIPVASSKSVVPIKAREESTDEEIRQRWRNLWDNTLEVVNYAYNTLVKDGMPAEEARGLLPHCTATRIQYVTDLRNLAEHAGNRLCTQAQFHWRLVFAQIVEAIRSYGTDLTRIEGLMPGAIREIRSIADQSWQFEAIADSGLFRPICYQLGHCPFQASFDRACSIRDRVQAYSQEGVPSEEWHNGWYGHVIDINPIYHDEWRLDPGAARSKQ